MWPCVARGRWREVQSSPELERGLVHPGGDLYEELKRCGDRMPEGRVAGEVLRPCLSALSYLHARVRPATARTLSVWRLPA